MSDLSQEEIAFRRELRARRDRGEFTGVSRSTKVWFVLTHTVVAFWIVVMFGVLLGAEWAFDVVRWSLACLEEVNSWLMPRLFTILVWGGAVALALCWMVKVVIEWPWVGGGRDAR